MSEATGPVSDTSAEKAYAEAAGAVAVDFPSAAKRKPAAVESEKAEVPAAVEIPAEVPAAEPVAVGAAPAKTAKAVTAKAAKPAPKAKATTAKTAAKPRLAKRAAPAPKTLAPKTGVKPVKAPVTPVSNLKDKIIMATKKTTSAGFTAPLKDAVAGVQKQAKDAYAKTSAFVGEYSEFAKGNVEAVVESGKILAAGLQDMGKEYVAEGKTAVETITSDVKQLATVKSPTDFFKLQSDIARRNIDSAIAYSSKNSEAMFKLANAVFAPISGRVTLAVDKFKKAA